MTGDELNYLVKLVAKCFQFMSGMAHGLSYMLDLHNLGHGLPALSHHNLENTLFESPGDNVTPSNDSQHELPYMHYTKFNQIIQLILCHKVGSIELWNSFGRA